MQRQFNFLPSRILAAMLVAAHSAAILALLSLPLPFWSAAALLLLLLFSLLHHLRLNAWLYAPSSSARLALEEEGVVLALRNGNQLAGHLLHNSRITPLLTVLNVLPQGAYLARSIVILPDSLDRESFRQLRVWLKWG